MSDIERFTIWGCVYTPAGGGEWVRYDDHRAEVERLTKERDAAQAEVERLKNAIDHLTSERNEAQAEVERLTARQTEMETHITGLTAELHRTRADGIELRWVADEVEQLTAERDASQANVERLKNAIDHLTSERDEARAEVERLTVRLEHAQARIVPPLPHADESAQHVQDKMDGYIASVTTELHETREKLARVQVQYDEFAKVTAKVIEQHQRERDDARQQVYRLKEACADRPTDEDIWREAFMAAIQRGRVYDRMTVADLALAEYRKRWPR